MNINDNGVNRAMTPEEIKELEKSRAQYHVDIETDKIVNPPEPNLPQA